MQYSIEIRNLYKSFGDVKAVKDLSFRVKTGELFAFLGENGAGKSTTISIICGSLQADAGQVLICGEDAEKASNEAKNALGVVFQNSVLDGALTVKDCLENRAALYGITGKAFRERLDELSSLLDFSGLLNRTIGKLSGGQRRRIDIARALLHRPKILILDEPTRGIDVGAKYEIYQLIIDLASKGKCVIMVSSEMPELLGVCDRILVMSGGRLAGEVDARETTQEEIMTLAAKNV